MADQARMIATDRVDDARLWTTGRVMDARGWAAPRLVRAARYVHEDLAPQVSAFLITTARRIEPPRQRRGRKMLTGLLVVGGMAGVIAGMIATRRGAERIAIDRIDEEAAGEPAAATKRRTAVNGQVDIP